MPTMLHFIKHALAALFYAPVPHRAIHGAMALVYAGSLFGLDKASITTAIALGYTLLALR